MRHSPVAAFAAPLTNLVDHGDNPFTLGYDGEWMMWAPVTGGSYWGSGSVQGVAVSGAKGSLDGRGTQPFGKAIPVLRTGLCHLCERRSALYRRGHEYDI